MPAVTSADAKSPNSFLSELKRRKVVGVAAAYFVVGWLLIEITSIMFPTFEAPEWTMKVFSLIVIMGFPLTLIITWAFEVTPDGIRRERDLTPEHRISRPAMLGASAVVFVLVIAATAYVLGWRVSGLDTAQPDPSVAVLPFVNLSDEPGTDYFSDGLSEEVLNTLAQIPGLRVPARTSSFAFRGRDEDVRVIGRSLDVTTVLEGSVRRSGQHIRVSTQLIDVRTGYQIWTQTYDRQLADVFVVQTDIARSIVDALSVKLGQEDQDLLQAGTANADAYELYLLGRHHLDSELGDWIVDSRQAFSKAIAADPQFARAFAGLADTYLVYRETPGSLMQGDTMPFDEAIVEAERAIDQALALEPVLADPYISRAAVAAARSDWASEERDLRTAIDLNPSLVRAFLGLGANLLAQGRPDEAHDAFLNAASLDPLNPQVAARLARLTAAMGDYDTAVSYPLRLLESGLRSPLTLEALVDISSAYGRFVKRVQWARELVRLSPTRAAGLAELADAYMELGEFDLADRWARRAADLSAVQAFKVRARLYAVRKDMVGLTRLVESAIQSDPPQPGTRLSPAQSVVMAVAGITYNISGDYDQAVASFSRVAEESSSLYRRSPEIPLMATNWLARSYLGAGEDAKAAELLTSLTDLAEAQRDRGFGQYPPFLWELALAHYLSGRGDAALQTWQDAIDRGWRHQYIQGGEFSLLHAAYANDARYIESARQVEADIAEMRKSVRANGWAETPEEFFARDRLIITGAR
jgi:TolB-like protein/Flp pilus assembly protein TadD